VLIEPADHPLTDAEISERFGGLLRAGVQAFRDDPEYLIAVAEDWARVHREPAKMTPAERERRAVERQRKKDLARAYPRDQREDYLRTAFAENRSGEEVAAELGVAANTVRYQWRKMGLDVSTRPRVKVAGRMGRPPKADTAERERIVRQHADQGLSQKQSAEALGISQAGVSLIASVWA
jgi:DNA-binding CsgD family transcriptional regulator